MASTNCQLFYSIKLSLLFLASMLKQIGAIVYYKYCQKDIVKFKRLKMLSSQKTPFGYFKNEAVKKQDPSRL
jgi:hypothetical protein